MAGMTIEDRLDVTDLVARYAECVDTADVDGYANLFLPDGVVEHSAGTVAGRDDIRAWVTDLAKQGRIGPGIASQTRARAARDPPATASAAPPAPTW